MKHLRLYEFFETKPSYDLNLYDFYTIYKKVYYSEKDKNPSYNGEFFNSLNDMNIYHWKYFPLNKLFEDMIVIYLRDKEIELIKENGEIEVGRVMNSKCEIWVFSKFGIELRVSLYESIFSEYIVVDTKKPIRVYGEKPKTMEIIEFLSSVNKYNL